MQQSIQTQIDAINTAAGSNPTPFQSGEIVALTLLQSGVSSTPVTAVVVNPIWASGGSVTLSAKTLTAGAGAALNAYGGPAITINNASPDYLAVGNLIIPYQLNGGEVLFPGAATVPAGLTVSQNSAGVAPAIKIASTGQGTGTGPGTILLTGAIANPERLGRSLHPIRQHRPVQYDQRGVGQHSGAERHLGDGAATGRRGGPSGGARMAQRRAGPARHHRWCSLAQWIGNSIQDAVTVGANVLFSNSWQAAGTSSYPTFDSWLRSGTAYLFFSLDNGNSSFPSTPVANGSANYLYTAPTNYTAFQSNTPPPNVTVQPSITAKNIAIVADIIDVNGAINAGSATNTSVSLGSLRSSLCIVGSCIPTLLGTEIAFDQAGYALGAGTIFPLHNVGVSATGDQQINASYDARNNQILLSDTAISGGGSVYLNGKIINSSATLGSINVAAGLGNMTVGNSTGIPVRLGNVSASQTPSQVTIVDTNQTNGSSSPLATWYVFGGPDNPAGLAVYNNTNGHQNFGLNDWRNPALRQLVSTSNSGSASYSPATNTAIEWDETGELSRTFTACNCPYPNETTASLSAWGWVDPSPGSTNVSPNPNAQGHFTVSYGLGTIASGRAYQQTIAVPSSDYYTLNPYDRSGNVVATKRIYSDLTLTLQNLARADYPIGINFTGGGGQVSVNSNASIVLGGAINNPAGTTAITASGSGAVIAATSAGSINSATINLQASAGIGSYGAPISVKASQAVNALTTNGSIYLAGDPHLTTPLPIGQVWSGWGFTAAPTSTSAVPAAIGTAGVVSISAPAGIQAVPGFYQVTAPNVIGEEIDLVAGSGGIGTAPVGNEHAAVPLLVRAVPVTGANGSQSGGIVNARAAGDIYLTQTAGDLRIGQIVSTGGDVVLSAAQGNIINANPLGGIDPTEQKHLDDAIAVLNLTGNDGSETIISFQNTANANYREYWNIARYGFPGGKPYTTTQQTVCAPFSGCTPIFVPTLQTFNLSGHESLFAGQAAASLGVASPTPQQIDQYVQGRFNTLTGYFDTLYNQTTVGLSNLQQFTAFQPKFAYVLDPSSQTYKNLIVGSAWQPTTLLSRIKSNALIAVSDTQFYSQTVNVQGQNITLVAAGNSAGNIGSSLPALVFTISNTAPQLTDDEAAALDRRRTGRHNHDRGRQQPHAADDPAPELRQRRAWHRRRPIGHCQRRRLSEQRWNAQHRGGVRARRADQGRRRYRQCPRRRLPQF